MYFQFIFIKALAEKFCQCFDSFFIGSTLTLHFFGQIRINTLKLYFLMFLLKTGNKCTVNIMLQDNGIFSCFLKHIDILTLLNFISYIENYCLLRFFRFRIVFVFRLCCIFFLFFCLSLSFFCFFFILFNAVL